MNSIIRLFACLIFVVAFASSDLIAQIPRTYSLQGVLTDAAGNTLPDGTHEIRVTLYTQSSGGSGLYAEIQSATVKNGVFSIVVGSITPIPGTMIFDRQYFAGISIDGGADLSPRTPLTAVPYALNAIRSEQAAALAPGATGVVTTVNGVEGAVTLVGSGSTTVTRSGQSILINSAGGGSTGIAGVQNTDGTIAVTNPNGPVATLGVSAGGITYVQLADNAVIGGKLANGSVSAPKIEDGSVTSMKITPAAVTTSRIADGAVTLDKLNTSGAAAGQVPTYNGASVAWTTPAAGGGGFSLPYTGSTANANPAFKITNSSGSAIEARTDGSADALTVFAGVGPSNAITATAVTAIGCKAISNSSTGVWGQSKSSRGVFGASTSGDGVAGQSSDGDGVSGTSTNGAGVVGRSTSGNGIHGYANDTGAGVRGTSTTVRAGLYGENLGGGTAVIAHSPANKALYAVSGSGTAVLAESTSGIGVKAVSITGVGMEVSSNSADLIKAYGVNTNLRFRVLNNGNVRCDGAFTGGGADLAEAFDFEGKKSEYEPGDVLVISADSDAKITLSQSPYSHMVVGVYATKPGVLLAHTEAENDISGLIPVGVVGVIPTKVCTENGPIHRGDLLTTSSTVGAAMKVHPVISNGIPSFPSGIILGKALENFDGPGTGLIRVFVNSK